MLLHTINQARGDIPKYMYDELCDGKLLPLDGDGLPLCRSFNVRS
jgi:hypothetical protein